MDLQKVISRCLIENGVDASSKGYIYLLCGVEYVLDHPTARISEVYKEVAEIYNVTSTQVQDCMIYALKRTPNYAPPKRFIYHLCESLRFRNQRGVI